MEAPPPVIKRPRGRPPKVKRGRKPNVPPIPENTQSTATSSLPKNSGQGISSVPSPPVDDIATPIGSKRSSPDGDNDYVPTNKRIRTESSVATPLSASSSASPRKPKPTILPARRSTRHTTIQATQMSEGTLRPPGPPCLEAALNIALRNLESEMWRYLWSYYKKHPAGPLPTPAAVKEACPRVRRAAEAVDQADRELEDAIDEIMRSSSKKKRRGGKQPEDSPPASSTRSPDADEEAEDSKPNSEWERGEVSNTIATENRIATALASRSSPEVESEDGSTAEDGSTTPDDTTEVHVGGSGPGGQHVSSRPESPS